MQVLNFYCHYPLWCNAQDLLFVLGVCVCVFILYIYIYIYIYHQPFVFAWNAKYSERVKSVNTTHYTTCQHLF